MIQFAATVIHTLFKTSRTDPTINETSSYVDLSILVRHRALTLVFGGLLTYKFSTVTMKKS